MSIRKIVQGHVGFLLTEIVDDLVAELEAFQRPDLSDRIGESDEYKRLITAGFEVAQAREMAKYSLECNEKLKGSGATIGFDLGYEPAEFNHDKYVTEQNKRMVNAFAKPEPEYVGNGKAEIFEYMDEKKKEPDRLAVIAEIFSDMPNDADVKAWETIKKIENKYGKDDVPGFDDVYPAIKKAAERLAGKVSLSEFLDVDKVRANQAPWDMGLPADSGDEIRLGIEINKMLAELAPYSGRKDCQVGPRTSERQEDGSVVQESVAAYHKRVKGKFNQMQSLLFKGVI